MFNMVCRKLLVYLITLCHSVVDILNLNCSDIRFYFQSSAKSAHVYSIVSFALHYFCSSIQTLLSL